MNQGKPNLAITQHPEGNRIDVTYKLDYDGVVAISVVVPLVNPTMLEMQAIACEQAAEGLRKYAENFRREIARQKGES